MKNGITLLRNAAIASLLMGVMAAAFSGPNGLITRIQVFSVGGNADTSTRIVSDGLAQEVHQSVVVESETGARGHIGFGFTAKAPFEGCTLIQVTGGDEVSAAIYEKQAFNPLRNFNWIGIVTTFPFEIEHRSGGHIQSMPDLIAKAHARSGEIGFSSGGIGSTQHLTGELLQSLVNSEPKHIRYRGGSAPLQDVFGGQVENLFDRVTMAKAQAQGGRLRVLDITSLDRNPRLPDAPLVSQTVPGLEVISWTGLAGAAGLPAPVIARPGEALKRTLARPDLRQRLEASGGVPAASQALSEVQRFGGGQIAKWAQVVRDAGIARQ